MDKEKNLEFMAKAYSVAEGVFPLWEAVFALIVGQIFIAYFSTNVDHWQKILIALLGLILSFTWLYLVGLNYLNADHINKKMLNLREDLNSCASTPFVWPWPTKEDKKNWNKVAVITGRPPGQSLEQKDALFKSTWFLRKILPGILSLFWFLLIMWQLNQIYIDSHKIIWFYCTRG